MDTKRSSLRRATVLALVGLAVIGSAAQVHAQEKPASSEPSPPSWPSAYPSPPQGATGAPPPVWPDQRPGAGYAQPGNYGPTPPAEPPVGYVRLPPPNVHDGFYLRLHFGVGSSSIDGKNAVGDQTTFSGVSGSLGVALGGTVAPNLVVFGTLIASIAEQPTVSVGQGASATATGSAGLFGVGLGAAYYFQPLNLYVSGALATLQVSLSDANDNEVYESTFGLGAQAIVGKEWWVSSEWGLGVALELIGATHMRDKNDSSITWSGRAASVLFSATYN